MGIAHYKPGEMVYIPPRRAGVQVSGGGAAAPAWWMAADVTPVAAYAAMGAANLAASYINLANPGTNNAAPGVAPAFDATRGWLFNGASHYLATGITPDDVNWTMIVRFLSGGTSMFRVIAGAVSTGSKRFYLAHDGTSRYYANDGLRTVAGVVNGGAIGVAGNQGYLDGAADGAAIGTFATPTTQSIYIGADHTSAGAAAEFYSGIIAEVVIYDVALTSQQVADITAAMVARGALTMPDADFALLSSQTLYSGAGATDHVARPVLLDDGDKWIMVYRQGAQHSYDADGMIHIRFSDDEGATWTAADTLLGGGAVTGAPFTGHSTNDTADVIIMAAPNGDLLIHIAELQASDVPKGTYRWRSTDGGATWSDDGQINTDDDLYGGQDYTVAGSEIYITTVSESWATPMAAHLYKSADNGATWTLVSEIATTTNNANETGVVWLGGNTLLAVLRDTLNAKTYQRISTDLGATWGTLTDVTAALGVLQRPRMRIFADEPDRIYLFGRDKFVPDSYTVLYFSDDDGATWSQAYRPDSSVWIDTGYCDMLKRADGSYYMLSYRGTSVSTVSVVEYIFEAA